MLDTLEAYRKTIRKNYNSSIVVARRGNIACPSREQAEDEYTLLSSALDNAWHYPVSTEAMQKVFKGKDTLKQVKLPPQNHVFCELSSPLPLGYSPYASGHDLRTDRAPIAAMWFYSPDLERSRLNRALSSTPGRWVLQLINTHGSEHDIFFYDVQPGDRKPGNWSLARDERQRQHESEKHLNTWRNRLREALFLIQQNGYRPGSIA